MNPHRPDVPEGSSFSAPAPHYDGRPRSFIGSRLRPNPRSDDVIAGGAYCGDRVRLGRYATECGGSAAAGLGDRTLALVGGIGTAALILDTVAHKQESKREVRRGNGWPRSGSRCAQSERRPGQPCSCFLSTPTCNALGASLGPGRIDAPPGDMVEHSRSRVFRPSCHLRDT